MYIEQLRIHNLRLFAEAEFKPGAGMNLVTGNNGSGKTSLLEAVYLLGRGRSFRHRESAPIIKKDCRECRVVADIMLNSKGRSRLGIERTGKTLRVRQDNKDLKRRSELFQALPLHLITPRSHEIIERGPELRRRFLDHAMFHVEHGYHISLFNYYHSIKQFQLVIVFHTYKLHVLLFNY